MTVNETATLEGALEAVERGESLVATQLDKKPWVKWKPLQRTRANADQVRAWAQDARAAGFAVITGKISNLVVLDFDGRDGIERLNAFDLEPHVQTGSGAYHVRFQYPGFFVPTQNSEVTRLLHDKWHGIDIRADGGYAIEWGASEKGSYETLRDLSEREPIERLPEELARDLRLVSDVPAEPNPRRKIRHPGRHARLLAIAGAMRGRGETEPTILAELRRVNKAVCEPPKPDEELVALAKDIAERYDPTPALSQLGELLGFGDDIKVTASHLFGTGADATLRIDLSTGDELRFEPAESMVRPQTVSAKVAIACGVAVHLKQPQCIEALALARKTANTQERYTEVDMATGWGVEFLQGADTLDFDSGNQAERFAVFGMVARLVPSENGYLVLRDRDGARWVRSGWFLEYVRLTAPRVSHVHLPTLMHEAGWERPKRIKATSPTASERRAWNFYVVSEGWEDR